MLNFKTVPKTLQGDICTNYLDLSNFELNPLCVPETIRKLRNRAIYDLDIITKYKLKTFFLYLSHQKIYLFYQEKKHFGFWKNNLD